MINPIRIFQFITISVIIFYSGLGLSEISAEKVKIKVVTTQTIFADLVREIGQDRVEVKSVASPKFNIHFIQPTPRDVKKVADADLYVNGGLDLEAWSDPLLEAAGRPQLFRGGERNLDLSQQIKLLRIPTEPVSRAGGDLHLFGNPHFQMDPENARPMAKSILAKLKKIDPLNVPFYEANAESFLRNLDGRISEWKKIGQEIKGKEIISYHDDIAYLAEFLQLKAEQFLEPKPGIPPTPKHLQFLADYITKNKVQAIVLPSYYSRKEAEKLGRKVGAKVVTIAQEPGEIDGTGDFFSFFDYNINQLREALHGG